MRDYQTLIDFLDERADRPFAWGSTANDCVSFAAAAVLAQTGRDLLADAGFSWKSAKSAARLLERVGGVAGAADLVLPRLEAPAFAMRGDIGLALIGSSESLVVFEGELLVGPGEAGTVRLPRALASIAWSVGQ